MPLTERFVCVAQGIWRPNRGLAAQLAEAICAWRFETNKDRETIAHFECGRELGVPTVVAHTSLPHCHPGFIGLRNWRACRSIYAPCYTPAGPAGFARNPEASRRVWSAHEGYPGDAAYRDFYRDIGFDLPMEHLGSIARGTRKFSGVKYHRITGRGDQKQVYDRTAAENAAAQHAKTI